MHEQIKSIFKTWSRKRGLSTLYNEVDDKQRWNTYIKCNHEQITRLVFDPDVLESLFVELEEKINKKMITGIKKEFATWSSTRSSEILPEHWVTYCNEHDVVHVHDYKKWISDFNKNFTNVNDLPTIFKAWSRKRGLSKVYDKVEDRKEWDAYVTVVVDPVVLDSLFVDLEDKINKKITVGLKKEFTTWAETQTSDLEIVQWETFHGSSSLDLVSKWIEDYNKKTKIDLQNQWYDGKRLEENKLYEHTMTTNATNGMKSNVIHAVLQSLPSVGRTWMLKQLSATSVI
jgi:hypothetical protein